jgi:hypothetical protein
MWCFQTPRLKTVPLRVFSKLTAEAPADATAESATAAPSGEPNDPDGDGDGEGNDGDEEDGIAGKGSKKDEKDEEKKKKDAQKKKPIRLSEELQLDDLWDKLSECLTELAKTPDQHAVLVLQVRSCVPSWSSYFQLCIARDILLRIRR